MQLPTELNLFEPFILMMFLGNSTSYFLWSRTYFCFPVIIRTFLVSISLIEWIALQCVQNTLIEILSRGMGTLKTKSSVLISHREFIVRAITHYLLLKQLYKDWLKLCFGIFFLSPCGFPFRGTMHLAGSNHIKQYCSSHWFSLANTDSNK